MFMVSILEIRFNLMNNNKDNKRISLIVSLPDVKENNHIKEYYFFTYKQIIECMPIQFSVFKLNEIKSFLDDIRITIRIEEIKLNKLNNKKSFVVTKTHYKKDSIYFNRFMKDIFKKLLELN